jgi:AcrR family transcriptional regulator
MTELRADARRNREELLDVARQVIREQGVDASLRDIARRADVGIATLYRHFPTREDLIAAIVSDGIGQLNARAAVLSEEESPGGALYDWLTDMARRIGPYQGLPELLDAKTADGSPLRGVCGSMNDTGARLLARAQAAGVVRDDVAWPDVFTAVAAISAISVRSGPDARDRVLRVYLDGLRTRPAGYAAS